AQNEILRRVRALPGVRGAAIWGPGIPAIDSKYFALKPEGAPDSAPTVHAESHIVTPGTLELLAVPIQRGRGFTEADTAGKPQVAIVSQSLGEALWPGKDPIGKRLLRYQRDTVPWTVVGVIKDARFQGRLAEAKDHLLLPQAQLPSNAETLLVKMDRGAAQLEPAIKEAIRKVDPQIPSFDFTTLEQRLWLQEGNHRLNAVIVGVYSALALILAVAGLYGMLAYSVVQRTKEIGLRMALGAAQPNVVGMFVRRALLLVAGGLAVGLVAAIVLARMLSSLLFGVKATDPLTILGASAIFLLIAFLATYLPARRAAKVEPTIALRFE
ncbi:MAG TPA: FtsX-like permease family protein, partial [Thermoanaerobaculia bacterium]|nr:FtsX-like permease family protein [Thermoanaerobaculia bacterium]